MPATLSLPDLDLTSDEPLEPVADIAERETGVRPHPTTIVRWCAGRGAAGIKLPSIVATRRRMTKRSVYRAWLQAVNDARNS
ncbi:DUF1580 domain-containing protein [Aeoliella sp. ICT_H6.2]|uniref:DUF1580 domain-containing protein n=1 Tax=Aeoliella straminimaris TaxID=2954799 RepID=A0A9X2JG22_9BACT|nr:DUF1580 domain-containing protein [Aeoliella straminimaris]MCO6044635.1 DUF1580 domain-containing protein [Aeoliella straminimaris]